MPIFDTHVYLEGYPLPGVNQNADQIAQVMQARGISSSVLFATRAENADPLTGNRILKAMIEPHNTLYAAVTAHTSRVEASIQAVKDLLNNRRFVGTMLIGQDPNAPLHPILADDILNACRRYQKPIFLYTPNAACVEIALHIAKSYSMHRFIFLGMGGKDWHNAVAAAHQATNTFLELSGELDNTKIPYAVNVLGAHRLLFGSGAPHQDPVAVMGLMAEAGLSSSNIQRILYDNAVKLFGLAEG